MVDVRWVFGMRRSCSTRIVGLAMCPGDVQCVPRPERRPPTPWCSADHRTAPESTHPAVGGWLGCVPHVRYGAVQTPAVPKCQRDRVRPAEAALRAGHQSRHRMPRASSPSAPTRRPSAREEQTDRMSGNSRIAPSCSFARRWPTPERAAACRRRGRYQRTSAASSYTLPHHRRRLRLKRSRPDLKRLNRQKAAYRPELLRKPAGKEPSLVVTPPRSRRKGARHAAH